MAGTRYEESGAHTDRLEVHRRGFMRASVARTAYFDAPGELRQPGRSARRRSSMPQPRHFAAREDGGVIPLVAVSQPFLTDVQITNFAVEAVTAAMTMDFANWRGDLSEASGYFEKPGGRRNFLAALEKAHIPDFVRERNLVTTVVANDAVISGSGLDGRGRHSWTIQVPLSLTYQSSNERTAESHLAEIVVSRILTWERPTTVGIPRITMRSGCWKKRT